MPTNQSDRRFLKRSLGISAGLHLVLLPLLFVAVPASLFGKDRAADADLSRPERVTISYLRIERRAPAPPNRQAPPPAVAQPRKVVVASAEPIRHAVARVVAVSVPVLARRAAPADVAAVVRSMPAAERVVAVMAPVRASQIVETTATAAPVAVAIPSATPSAAPSAIPAVQVADAGSARGIDVGPGGWGQNFDRPIVADDSALADLRAKYHDVAHATIEVDDAGHAVRVTLPAGMPDDQRSDLEHRLMELRYVPAECNGLHCPGTLQLTL